MLTDVRRVGLVPALVVVLVMGGLTYLVLTMVAGTGPDRDVRVVRAATTVSTTARKASEVGAVQVANGKLTYSGAIRAPRQQKATMKPKPKPKPASVLSSSTTRTQTAGTLAAKIGQTIVTPLDGTVADPGLLARIRAGQVGGVILFGSNIRTLSQVKALTTSLQAAAQQAGRPGLLIMTDQEGGTVKRLQSQPPAQSAAQMGVAGNASAQGTQTGAALAGLGINVDLAPVADVPTSASNFLGTRAFARSPSVVSRSACQFSAGLHRGGVASSLKHFPGLGRAAGNTDDGAVHIQAGTAQLAAGLAPYRRCAGESRTMVMVSNASYSGLTGTTPAVVSPSAYALLRTSLGFTGVTISDSLNAGAVNALPGLAVRAAAAGLDLQLWTSVAGATQAYNNLAAAARTGALSRARVNDAAGRIHQLKQSMGLA